jgi:hypothetical protein
MAILSENNFSDVKKSITGLKEKVEALDNGTAEKIKALKKSFAELEDKLIAFYSLFPILYKKLE